MARADDLRAARGLFERAMANGTTLEECRRREAAERWAAIDERRGARTRPASESEAQPRFWYDRD